MNILLTGDEVELLAEMCHEANRRYCASLGDDSQLPWREAPEWQRESLRKGVRFHEMNPGATPAASHESWLREKRRTGWTYGPVKDEARREHPCYRPYAELPIEQRRKDHIFRAIVNGYLMR